MVPVKYFNLFCMIKFTSLAISCGSPIFFVGNFFSNSFKFGISSLTLPVLKGPGAILITEIFFFEYSLLKDFNKLLKAILSDDDINNELPGSLIKMKICKKYNRYYLFLYFLELKVKPKNN